jgi:hypothetical protein
MADTKYVPLQPDVGINRDGTSVASTQYNDGVWVRFFDNCVMKMGGYKVIVLGDVEKITDLFSFDAVNSILLYVGQPSHLIVMNVYEDLSTTVPVDRTPVNFVSDVNNTWSVTSVSYKVDAVLTAYVIATACPNGSDVSNTTEGLVYYGAMTDSSRLVPVPFNDTYNVYTAGGVVVLGSYIMVYGSNGGVFFNDGLSIDSWPNENFIQFGSSKIVYAAPVRQGGVVVGLFWALDYVFSLTFVAKDQGDETFQPAYASTSSTIIAPGSVVTFDPQFYWIGINSFYVYNGVVQPLINNTNKLWFFKNLNMEYKEKIRGFYNKKFNEVCWLAPMFGATENNWMIRYNIESSSWDDTPLTRSCAISSSSQMSYPIMASSTLETINGSQSFPIWAHEFGYNRIDPVQTTAILSSFTTNKTWLIDQDAAAQVLEINEVIPDLEQTSDMFFTVNTQGYPRSPVVVSDNFVVTPTTEFVNVRVKGSIVSLTFTSNVLDGDFLFGKTMIGFIISGDQRPGPSLT